MSGCLSCSGTKASVLKVLAFVCLIRNGVQVCSRVEIRSARARFFCCRDVRRSLSSSPPSSCFQPVSPPLRLWWFRGPAPRGLGPFPAPVPLSPSFVFVSAALLVACLAALVLEVSLVGYVSESSWETAFSSDKFVTGVATWNETDSLNSVWQSPKSNLPGPFSHERRTKFESSPPSVLERLLPSFLPGALES